MLLQCVPSVEIADQNDIHASYRRALCPISHAQCFFRLLHFAVLRCQPRSLLLKSRLHILALLTQALKLRDLVLNSNHVPRLAFERCLRRISVMQFELEELLVAELMKHHRKHHTVVDQLDHQIPGCCFACPPIIGHNKFTLCLTVH